MRTRAQQINTTTKRTVVGVVVLVNISLGFETVVRELKLMGVEQISNVEAESIAAKKYTSIVHAGGRVSVASIEKYQPITLGIKEILSRLRINS